MAGSPLAGTSIKKHYNFGLNGEKLDCYITEMSLFNLAGPFLKSCNKLQSDGKDRESINCRIYLAITLPV